jgi:hypothetical protein
MINFILLTYSREQYLKGFFQRLSESRIHKQFNCRLIISDSGLRGKSFFEDIFDEIDDFDIEYEYLATKASHLYENMDFVSKERHEPSFYFHDDDEINWSEVKLFLDVYKKRNFSYGFCFKAGGKPYLIYSLFKNQGEDFKIALSYIMTHNGNCPLVSGIFFSDPSEFVDISNQLFLGKYKDVGLMMHLVNLNGVYIHPTNYILYNDHDSNDNKSRDLEARDNLSSFLKSKGGLGFSTLSGLVYWGYRERLFMLICAYLKILLQPKMLFLFLIKVIYRIKLIPK